jgi:hypothetical protein
MTALFLALALLLQGDPADDPTRPPREVQRLRDLALHDRAEEAMREALRKVLADPQQQRHVPRHRAALCEILLEARKFPELKQEAEPLRQNRDPQLKALGWSFLAVVAWRTGEIPDALKACDEAEKAASERSANAFPDVRRRVRATRAYAGWKRHESATHVLHFPPDSPLASDPDAFGRRLDQAFERIRASLHVAFEGKIDAFFFKDQGQADEILGQPLDIALPRERAYFARHDSGVGYAMASVVSFYAANRREKFPPHLPGLAEGFAAAQTDDPLWNRRRDEIPRRLAKEGRLPVLAELLARPPEDARYFAIAGSFVRWLIRARGAEKFARLWEEFNDHAKREDGSTDLLAPWIRVYGAALPELEKAWRSSIR